MTPPALLGSVTDSTETPVDVLLTDVSELEAGRVPFQLTVKAGPSTFEDAQVGVPDSDICSCRLACVELFHHVGLN